MSKKQFNIRKKIAKHKWFVEGLVGLTMAGSLLLNKDNTQKELPKIVQAGEAEYNKGSLVSYGFVSCSVVVIDYGDSALMAHAIPLLEPKFEVEGKESITAGGVIEYLVQESKRLGLNPEKARAHINAGNKESLEKIIKALNEKNIPIIEAKIRFDEGYNPNCEDSRTILYSPSKNKLSVFKKSEFPDYQETTN